MGNKVVFLSQSFFIYDRQSTSNGNASPARGREIYSPGCHVAIRSFHSENKQMFHLPWSLWTERTFTLLPFERCKHSPLKVCICFFVFFFLPFFLSAARQPSNERSSCNDHTPQSIYIQLFHNNSIWIKTKCSVSLFLSFLFFLFFCQTFLMTLL